MKRGLLLMGLLAGLTLGAVAQKVLTFEDAVKLALDNSVLLNQQKNNLEYNQMQKTSSIASIGPSVTLGGTAQQFNGNSFNQQQGRVIIGVRDNVSGSINANMNLFSGFARINSIRQYSNLADAQSYFVKRTAQDAINTVAGQYLTVMLDVELLRIARQNFEALNKQLDQVKEQVRLGAKSPVDEYNQDALTKAAELRMVQAEVNLNNDKTTLTQSLLMDPFEQYDVEKPAWDLNKLGYDGLTMEDLAEKAKAQRGDYQRAVSSELSAKFGMRASRGFNMMPSVYLFGSYGSSYNFAHDQPDSVQVNGVMVRNQASFSDQFKTNNVYKAYGIQVNIPLFNGLQYRTTVAQQKVLYENAQWTKKSLEYQIKNDVIRAVRNYEAARKAYQVSVDQLTAAEAAFELEKERYNLGVTNFVDFTNANRVLVQAQTDKAQNEYKLVFQRISIEYAVGTLKADDLE
jgi:outer membrane protein